MYIFKPKYVCKHTEVECFGVTIGLADVPAGKHHMQVRRNGLDRELLWREYMKVEASDWNHSNNSIMQKFGFGSAGHIFFSFSYLVNLDMNQD